jgi:hypothetical protein
MSPRPVLSSACAAARPVDTAAEEQALLVVSEQWLQAEEPRDAGAIAALFTGKRDPLSRGSRAGGRIPPMTRRKLRAGLRIG